MAKWIAFDNEVSEVISVKQTMEANGETIGKKVLNPMDEEEANKGLDRLTGIKAVGCLWKVKGDISTLAEFWSCK